MIFNKVPGTFPVDKHFKNHEWSLCKWVPAVSAQLFSFDQICVSGHGGDFHVGKPIRHDGASWRKVFQVFHEQHIKLAGCWRKVVQEQHTILHKAWGLWPATPRTLWPFALEWFCHSTEINSGSPVKQRPTQYIVTSYGFEYLLLNHFRYLIHPDNFICFCVCIFLLFLYGYQSYCIKVSS